MEGTRATTRATSTHMLRPRTRQQPANRAAATAGSRGARPRHTADGAAAPSLARCPAAEWPPRRLHCLQRPSRGTCGGGWDAKDRLGGRRGAACQPRRSDTRRHAEAAKTPVSKPRGGAGVRSVCSRSKPASVLRKADGKRAPRSDGALGAGSEHAHRGEKKQRARACGARRRRRAAFAGR